MQGVIVILLAMVVSGVVADCTTTGCASGVCSPHDLQCVCPDGRTGSRCELYTCATTNPPGSICSGYGVCRSNNTCDCIPERQGAGLVCLNCAPGRMEVYYKNPGCWPSTCVSSFPGEDPLFGTKVMCGLHGSCVNSACVCDPGHSGAVCWS
jgi:hypothetical protein